MKRDYPHNTRRIISVEATEFNIVIDLNPLAPFVLEAQFIGLLPGANHIERLRAQFHLMFHQYSLPPNGALLIIALNTSLEFLQNDLDDLPLFLRFNGH